MIVLRPANLHWIGGVADNPTGLCAHSGVEFQIDDTVLLRATDADWAVSAAALFLLRTLSKPHTRSSPVGAQLIPHCGQLVCAAEGDEALVFCCNTGVDFEIRHVGNGFQLAAPDGRFFQLPSDEWRDAVARFSDAVAAFYAASSPKAPVDADAGQRGEPVSATWSASPRAAR